MGSGRVRAVGHLGFTHRPLSSSSWEIPYRILNMFMAYIQNPIGYSQKGATFGHFRFRDVGLCPKGPKDPTVRCVGLGL